MVFAGRGISQEDYPAPPKNVFASRPFEELITKYADDYAGIDVRGKIVLLVRFAGVRGAIRPSSNFGQTPGPYVADSIANAIKRGAAAVIFVDPALDLYTDVPFPAVYQTREGVLAGPNPYLRIERESPPTTLTGVPVIVLDTAAAEQLLAPLGLDMQPFIGLPDYRSPEFDRSPARDLGVTARVEVPLSRQVVASKSLVAEVPGISPQTGRVMVWLLHSSSSGSGQIVLGAIAQVLGPRRAPFVLVDFDDSGDAAGSTAAVREVLADRRIVLVVVLDQLQGSALKFVTPYGELIPALDLYADRANARHEVTRTTELIGALSGVAPLVDVRTVVIRGSGTAGDLRPDAAAFIGYLAGREDARAEELPR